MNRMVGVSLQISLAPTDLPHARHILPHQLKQWAGQVDEILFTVDLHRSRGRYSEGWKERLPGLRRLLNECCADYPHAHSVDVDYSPEAAAQVSALYFSGQAIPAKNWNGAPFYAYFFGLYAAQFDYVLHLDSDTLYGGGSQTWVAEAIELLRERPDVLSCGPLAGPPTADGRLQSQVMAREPYNSVAYSAPWFSTRYFFLDRCRFCARIAPLTVTEPPFRRAWQACIDGNPPSERAEVLISRAMAEKGMRRVDFLGCEPGVWALHPPYRSVLFYERLPRLIEQVESGDMPEAQRGDHDMNDSMIDWSSARKSFWQRVGKHVRLGLQHRVPESYDEEAGAAVGSTATAKTTSGVAARTYR